MKFVLIAAEPVFRFGFRKLVEASEDLLMVADASDARTAFRAIDLLRPDAVVADVALKGMNGITTTREVRCRAPDARVLLLAAWPCEREAIDGFAAGAHGFALKTEPSESLLYALRTVASGEIYVTPELRGLTTSAVENLRAKRMPQRLDVLAVLSRREHEVLDLVVKGWRNREIARELCVSIKTVDTHRSRINRKLRCSSAADLIRFAANNGLLDHHAPAETDEPAYAVLQEGPAD